MRFLLQLTLCAVLFVLLAAQMPARALFFRPHDASVRAPAASFVELDEAAYDALVARTRMAWQMADRRRVGASDVSGADGLPTPAVAIPAPLAHGAFRTVLPSAADGFRPSDLRPAAPRIAEPAFAADPDVPASPAFSRADMLEASFILDSPERK